MDVKEQDILGDALYEHWYYIAKGRALRRFLGKTERVDSLDVGAGSGIFTKQFIDAGLISRGVCIDPAYAEEKIELYAGCEIEFVKSLSSVTQNLIMMIDVLEHVDDDLGLLTSYTDHLPRGGQVLISVPAFQFLWSSHDDFLEHKRRYTLGMVENLVSQAGLKIKRSRYFFGSLLPMIVAIRLMDRAFKKENSVAKSQLSKMPPILNKALIWAHDIERMSILPWNKTAGLSVFCLATKL